MAWRDRLRRRATAPGAGGTPAGPGSAQPAAPGAMSTPAPASAGPSVPRDWDGGWRRTQPPTLTVARSTLGVSDGLAFRSGLASWQNPSFDAGLGHALLPSAPVGLVRGVTGPATPRTTRTDGGPLLLRAPRPQAEEAGPHTEGPVETRPDTAGTRRPATPNAPQVSRRTRPGAGPRDTGKRDDSGARQRTGGDTPGATGTPHTDPGPAQRGTASDEGHGATASPSSAQGGQSGSAAAPSLQRSTEPAPSRAMVAADPLGTVTAPETSVQRSAAAPGTPATPGPDLPVVRRIAVVPHSTGEATAPRTPSGAGSTANAGRTAPRRQDAGGTAAHDASAPPAHAGSTARAGASGTAGTRSVHPRALGPALTVARRPSTPARRIAALRPAPAAPTAPRPAAGPDAAPTGTAAQAPNATPPVQDTAKAAPSGRAATNPAPAVQRAADPVRPGSRAPLGAPVPELPATARPLTGTGPETAGPAADAHPTAGPSLPIVQRLAGAPAAGATPGPSGADTATPRNQTAGANGPAPAAPEQPGRGTRSQPSGARVRGGLGAPLSALPPTADLPRPHGAARAGGGPGAPSPSMPQASDASRPAGPGGAADRPARGGGAALPDVQRAPVRPDRPAVDAPASASDTRTPSAPLLGATGAEVTTSDSAAPQGISAAAPNTADGPSTPLVAPATPLVAPVLPRSEPSAAAGPGPVQRAVTPEHPAASSGAVTTTGTGGPGPVVVTRVASSETDSVQRAATSQTRSASPRGEGGAPVEASGRARTAAPGATATGAGGPSRGATPSRGAGAPGPLVVARSVPPSRPGPDAAGARTPAAVQRLPLTAPGQRTAPRTLALLAARPLTVNTRAPEGFTPPAATGGAGRPVVAASWRRDADPVAGTATPSPGPRRGVPHVQRTAAGPAPSGPGAGSVDSPSGTAGSPQRQAAGPAARPGPPVRRAVPVVRPHAPVQRTAAGGDMAVRPLTLPVSDPQAPALQDRPNDPGSVSPPVPVVRATRTAPASSTSAAGRTGGSTGPAVQREATRGGGGAVPAGVPVTAVPPRGRQRSASAPPAPGSAGGTGTGSAGARQEPVVDLDELARRLVDPLARLLRADLRRGRERAGRPYDGRR
ncbi:hypothetical protein AB0G54_26675 [Streptomyces yokosukanensis]|uniref:hypothetical protein n=1 Tax=Streptomyces yokosukanensis TaxID=67386 RepID=UPI003439BCB1